MKSSIIFTFLAFMLCGCTTTDSSQYNVSDTEVSVSEVAVIAIETDEDGDLWFSGKATVSNHTDERIKLDVVIQGIDSNGFEIEDLWIEGHLAVGETKTLTDRYFTAESNFKRIVEWRLKAVDYELSN